MRRIKILDLTGILINKLEADDATADEWLKQESERGTFGKPGQFTVVQEDMSAEVAARIAASAAKHQAFNALIAATPGTLTNVQRDTILIHLVKQALGQ